MFDTLKEILHKVAKSRIFVLCVVMILLSSTLIGRLFYLQIIKGEEYQDNYSLKIQKPRILNGSRGNIYDRNGNLQSMNEDQVIEFSGLNDSENKVQIGDQIVTSNVSDKYLQGILVGYVSSISEDSNHLTKSGTITPAVDFEHLQQVLVILDKKETGSD